MKTVFRFDNVDYEDFSSIISIVEDNDYVLDVSLKRNDNSIYSLSGYSGHSGISNTQLNFENVILTSGSSGVLSGFAISGSVYDSGAGILRFDLTNAFSGIGGNVYRSMLYLNDAVNSKEYNIYTGKLIIVNKIGE